MQNITMKARLAVLVGLAAWLAPVGRVAGAPAQTTVYYKVSVERGSEQFSFQAPTYTPACLADTKSSYSAWFERHNLCATVVTSTGYALTDDISLQVATTKGLITSAKLRGQDIIGEEGIMHESESIPILPPVSPSSTGFTLHIHADNVPIWKLHNHLGGKRVEIVGYVSLADAVYTLKP